MRMINHRVIQLMNSWKLPRLIQKSEGIDWTQGGAVICVIQCTLDQNSEINNIKYVAARSAPGDGARAWIATGH